MYPPPTAVRRLGGYAPDADLGTSIGESDVGNAGGACMAERAYLNKRCPRCGWKTYSWISFNYRFCPMCGAELEEYDMRRE